MTQALAQQENIKALVFANQKQHAVMLPADQQSQVAGWLSSAYAALSKDRNLAQAAMSAPETFVNAMNDAAQHGLRPGTTEYYLTPRKNKGRMEVLGIVGYQGHIEMMYRSGKVRSVIVEAVHENDEFTWVPGEMEKPVFKPASADWFSGKKTRGDLVGAFAYAVFNDGNISQVVIADADRIDAAKDASAGSNSQYSPWVKHPKSMYLKTVAHDLAKWVPTSAVDLREKAQAQLGEASATANVNAAGQVLAKVEEPAPQEVYEDEYIADIVDEEPAEPVKPASATQLKEIQKRAEKLGYESPEQLNSDIGKWVGEGKTLDSLSFDEADTVLSYIPAQQ